MRVAGTFTKERPPVRLFVMMHLRHGMRAGELSMIVCCSDNTKPRKQSLRGYEPYTQ